MSALRQCLKRPHTYLAILVVFFAAAVLDSFRPPADQWTASLYVHAVRVYQKFGRPVTRIYIQCRYVPTCSEYSLQAVQTHGIKQGLGLTYRRLARCTTAVPPGTQDPVPQ